MKMAELHSKADKLAAAKKKLREFQTQQKKKATASVITDVSSTPVYADQVPDPSAVVCIPAEPLKSTGSVITPDVSPTPVYTDQVPDPSDVICIPAGPSRIVPTTVPFPGSEIKTVAFQEEFSTPYTVQGKEQMCTMLSEKNLSEISINISDSSNDYGDVDEPHLPIASFFSEHPSHKTYTSDNFFDRLMPATSNNQMNITDDRKPDYNGMEPFVNVFRADVENGAVFHDELINDNSSDKPDSISSTDSHSDYMRKLSYSITAQDSIEHPSQSSDISELERRNEELISALHYEKKRRESVSSEFASYKQKTETIINEFVQKENDLYDTEMKLNMRIADLEISMSERSSSYEQELQQVKNEVNKKNDQIRMLEIQLDDMKNVQQKNDLQDDKYQKLLNENMRIADKLSILEGENIELDHRLKLQSERCLNLEKQIEKYETDISTLQIKLDQAASSSSEDDIQYREKHQKMLDRCKSYEETVSELQEQVKCLGFERDQLKNNYQNCLEALNADHRSAIAKLHGLDEENFHLKQKLSSQTDHISTLEKQLQQNQNQLSNQQHVRTQKGDDDTINVMKMSLKEQEKANEILRTNLQSVKENETYLESKIFSLENVIERMKQEQTDVERLQVSIESDKVAASQAISQNNKLKKEYESLQNAFITLNQTNAEVVEKLEREKLLNQDLQNQIAKLSPMYSFQKSPNVLEEHSHDPNMAHSNDRNEDNPVNMNAMLQLQEKFKDVVNKMADLTDEKQQLEHLVMQLQSETETIGEYVTLYQKQRYLLNQKALERDKQVSDVLREKNELTNRLIQLNQFIQTLPADIRNDIGTVDFKGEIECEKRLPVCDNVSSGDSDGVLHPTSCYCSGRRVITV